MDFSFTFMKIYKRKPLWSRASRVLEFDEGRISQANERGRDLAQMNLKNYTD